MSDIFNMADTWNNGATVFSAIKMDVTDTASDAASLLFNLQVGSAEKLTVGKTGTVNIWNVAGANYERGFARWASNVFEIGVEKGGSGTDRVLKLRDANMSIYWESGLGVRFRNGAGSADMEITASGMIFGVGNSRIYEITTGTVAIRAGSAGSADYFVFANGTNEQFRLSSAGVIGFSSNTDATAAVADTAIIRGAAGIMTVTNGSTGGAAMEFREQTAPSAPSTNSVRLYAEDNGSGKTRLMALFATGAAQQVAIEP